MRALSPGGQSEERKLVKGTTLGRYVLLGELGVGAQGRVFAAYDTELDRKVALKILSPPPKGSEDHPNRQLRLIREAKALARLNHPNVVVVHDAGKVDGRFVISMELVEGQTLRQWLETPRT